MAIAPVSIRQYKEYYRHIEGDFHRLDIAGIDNDRAFEIQLSEIYVRLRACSMRTHRRTPKLSKIPAHSISKQLSSDIPSW